MSTHDSATATTAAKAVVLQSLHRGSGTFVLPNAWDAITAAIIAARGARAIATTSGGVSWCLGRPDGTIDRDDSVRAIGRIVDAVAVPVTADIETSYGPDPADIDVTVTALIQAGVAGINLEDSPGRDAPLVDTAVQVGRIEAARVAAERQGVNLVINARTDGYLLGLGAGIELLDHVLDRAYRYAAGGADCLFVPGLTDPAIIKALVKDGPVPLNIMAVAGGPTVSELAKLGVRRVSVGTAIAQAAYALVDRAAEELLERGTYTTLEGQLSYTVLNDLVRNRPSDECAEAP